jgi:excinuclease ABC subunit B
VIVVASVSCIYGLGDPDAYYGMIMFVEKGLQIKREDFLKRLVELQYERSHIEFERGTFRVRGDVVELYPSYQENAYRFEFWGDEIEAFTRLTRFSAKSFTNTNHACRFIRKRIT